MVVPAVDGDLPPQPGQVHRRLMIVGGAESP